MRKGVLLIMVFGWLFGPPSSVQKATEAYGAAQYAEALAGFNVAQESYPTQLSALSFNVGQCWFRMDSIAKAQQWYGKVTNTGKESPQMASWAWNNLGCIFASAQPQGAPGQMPGMMPGQAQAGMPMGMQGPPAQQGGQMGQLEQALQAFKDALKLDHDNELARYNYELIKHKIQQQQQQQNQDQNQDQQQQDQQQQDQQDQQQQKGQDQKQDQPQNQENKGNPNQQQGEGGEPQQMSAAEAERLLEAMNANEKKFLQQIEKGKKHRTYNDDGPDW
jgi:tetratricopeptide (TPR) repeat protein